MIEQEGEENGSDNLLMKDLKELVKQPIDCLDQDIID